MSENLKDYTKFVNDYIALHENAARIPLGEAIDAPETESKTDKKIMVCSPHPDDEVVVGALPYRLRKELGANVINLAVTLGSNKDRKIGRLEELVGACRTLGFKNIVPGGDLALDGVNPKTRDGDSEAWSTNVSAIADVLRAEKPDVLLFPHDNDYNSTHIGVHYLMTDALAVVQKESPDWTPIVFQTEFWHAMETPNLMVGITPEDEAVMIFALAAHTGEVERNPYHVTHPSRMMDNVCRGSEVVGGQGGASVDMKLAMIYKASKFINGNLEDAYEGGRILGPTCDLSELINL